NRARRLRTRARRRRWRHDQPDHVEPGQRPVGVEVEQGEFHARDRRCPARARLDRRRNRAFLRQHQIQVLAGPWTARPGMASFDPRLIMDFHTDTIGGAGPKTAMMVVLGVLAAIMLSLLFRPRQPSPFTE